MLNKKNKIEAGKPGLYIFYIIIWVFPFIILLIDFLDLSDLSVFFKPNIFRLLLFTLFQAALSTVICFLLALVPAYYMANKENKITKVLDSLIIVPFFFPPISVIVAFTLLFSSVGLFANFGINLNIMYTMTIIIVAHVFYNSPIFVKYLSEGLKRIPKEVLEASELDGANRIKQFFLIELPYIVPSIRRAFFLVFTFCFTSFAVILSLGGIQFSTIEVAIVSSLRNNLDFSKALSLAILQLVALLVINFLSGSKEINKLDEMLRPKKKVNIVILGISIVYLLFELSIIITSLGASFFDFINSQFDFSILFSLFSAELNNKYPVIKSIINSLFIAGIVSFCSVTFTYFIVKYRIRHSNIFILSSMGISSAFLAMGLLYLHIVFDVPFFLLLTLAYFFITVPIAYSFLYQHIAGFNKNLLEAASVEGASKFKIFRFIELPILFPILISTFLQIMAIAYGEFTIAYTMQVYDLFPISSVVNFSLNSHRLFKESAVFSSVNVIIIFILYFLSLKLVKKKMLQK